MDNKNKNLQATLPREGYGDDACEPRLRKTLERLTHQYDGNLLLVGHGASIGAIHEVRNIFSSSR